MNSFTTEGWSSLTLFQVRVLSFYSFIERFDAEEHFDYYPNWNSV